jgi:hypothetical protein
MILPIIVHVNDLNVFGRQTVDSSSNPATGDSPVQAAHDRFPGTPIETQFGIKYLGSITFLWSPCPSQMTFNPACWSMSVINDIGRPPEMLPDAVRGV